MMADILETYYQLKAAGQFEDVGFFTSIGLLLSDTLNETAKVAYKAAFDVSIEEQEVANVEEMWQKYMQESLDSSHRVLLVSHSQGNLFANRIYKDYVLPLGYGEYFANLQVATPANRVEADLGQYVTLSIDPVINPIPGSLKANAHGFPGHSFVAAYLKQSDPLNKIMGHISSLIAALDDAPSQWRVRGQDTACLSGKMVVMENRLDPSLPSLEDVYFEREGKLRSNGAMYLFGTCRSLDGEEDPKTEVIAQEGFITVGLDWSNPGVNMDLGFDAGSKDIDDVQGIAQEHYVVPTESDIAVGYYGIYVTHDGADAEGSQCLDETPLTLVLNVSSPDGVQTFAVDIKSESDLDLGHIAGLYVQEKETSLTLHEEAGTDDSNGTSTLYRPRTWIPIHTVTPVSGTIRSYEMIPHLQQALLGPLGGASIRVVDVLEANKSVTLYSGTTTYGGSNLTTGLLALPEEMVASLQDDGLYHIEVSGGEDIDADDDLSIDARPTLNKGTVHAILSGEQIRTKGIKINILTTIAYQACRDRLDNMGSLEEIQGCLDGVSNRLLLEDIDDDGRIDRNDLAAWTPYFHKSKLKVDYRQQLVPIVAKVYDDQDIGQDVYRLLLGTLVIQQTDYDVQLGAFVLTTASGASVELLEKVDMTLIDSDGHEVNGSVTYDSTNLYFTPLERLDDDGRTYRLDVHLDIEYGGDLFNESLLSKTLVIPDKTAPTFTIGDTYRVEENTQDIVWLDAFDISGEVSLTIVGGNDATSFMIDEEGQLRFSSALDFEWPRDKDEDNRYQVTIRATDIAGNSSELGILITVVNLFEPLVLDQTILRIDENTKVGTQVGVVNLASRGEGALRFEIDTDILRIDDRGRVYLNRPLSFEYPYNKLRSYLYVVDKSGQTQSSILLIDLQDIEEVLPEIWPMTLSLAENTPAEAIIGKMPVYGGKDDVAVVTLSGEGAEDFVIDPQGNVQLRAGAKVDSLSRSVYHLLAVAKNSRGSSTSEALKIYVDEWSHQFDREEESNAKVLINGQNDIYVVGKSLIVDRQSPEYGKAYAFVRKYDSSGQAIWTDTQQNMPDLSQVSGAVCDHDGGLYVLGTTQGTPMRFPSGDTVNMVLMRYAFDGTLLWQRQYGSNGFEHSKGIAIDRTGGLYVLGSTNTSMFGAEHLGEIDAVLMHLDADGDVLWTRQYGGSDSDYPIDIAIDSKRNALLVLNVAGKEKFFKVDPGGGLLWSQESGLADEGIVALQVNADDEIYVTGTHHVYFEGHTHLGNRQAFLVKYDRTAYPLWQRSIASSGDVFVNSLALDSDGDVIVAGSSTGDLDGDFLHSDEADVFLSHFDTDGRKQWTRVYGSMKSDANAQVAIDQDDSIYLTGETYGSVDGSPHSGVATDVFLIKTAI